MNQVNKLKKEIAKLTGLDDIKLRVPQGDKQGDLSTDDLISRDLSTEKKQKIITNLSKLSSVKEAQFKGAGFLNIYLSQAGKEAIIREISEDNLIKKIDKKKKIQVEYVSANPTGPLTLGNGRGAFAGEALANIYQFLGYEVEREYYINDIGRQIKILADSIINIKEGQPRQYKKEELYKGDYIKNLAEKIEFSQNDKLLTVGQKAAYKIIKDYIKPTLNDLGVEFDNWQKESQLYKQGYIKQALTYLKDKGLIYKKEGATWFKAGNFSDSKDRVVKRKNGNYTYFASDIGYCYQKFKEKKLDKVINFWGADHHGYVDRFRGMLEAFGWANRWRVVIFQLVNIIKKGQRKKMSKRKGEFVLLSDLVEEIGADAAKFIFLSYDYGKAIDIDLKKVKKRSKDSPVYYIQYAFARISGIEEKQSKIKPKKGKKVKAYRFNNQESKLIAKMAEFEDVLRSTIATNQVHILANYANDLAKEFHSFYKQSPILRVEKKVREKRLNLTMANKKILKDSLNLLGISAPEKM